MISLPFKSVPSNVGVSLILAETPDNPEAIPAEPNPEDAWTHHMQKASSGRLSGAFENKGWD
jgi:hypothetical protein